MRKRYSSNSLVVLEQVIATIVLRIIAFVLNIVSRPYFSPLAWRFLYRVHVYGRVLVWQRKRHKTIWFGSGLKFERSKKLEEQQSRTVQLGYILSIRKLESRSGVPGVEARGLKHQRVYWVCDSVGLYDERCQAREEPLYALLACTFRVWIHLLLHSFYEAWLLEE